jgi:stearoyl-CoA desaturase (delta-9 desaturase)
MPFEGLIVLSTWGYVGVALLLTHITIVSVTVFLHRHQAHNALDLKPPVSHFFRFWLWLTTGTVTREWVAVHRKHHARCETEDDPHSPRYKGILRVLFGGLWLYRAEASRAETLARFGQGTPDDWLERRVYSAYTWLGILLMLIIDVVLFGLPGIGIFAVQMIWIPFWAAGVINGLGHYLGYRGFETSDASTNIVPWGIIVGGEELHNNHHAYAASARLSNRWYEIDLGWIYIRLLAFFRLARIKRLAPRAVSTRNRYPIDRETVRAVVSQRFYILKRYSQIVIRPALREARRNTDEMGRLLIQRAKKFLTREDILAEGAAAESVEQLLQQDRTLATVYHFKQQLKEVWKRGAEGQPGRVERLQAWCAACEQSGIRALEEFAEFVRGYRLQPA